jgi:large subunit ribosomal protein L13e
MAAVTSKVLKKNGKQRRGKGFSREELKKAGSNTTDALKLHIPLDFKRRTAHEENIENLKAFFASRKAVSKPRLKSKS